MAKTNRHQHAEGALFRRSDGQWRAVVELPWKDGRRQRRVFAGRTPQDAKDRRDAFLAARKDGFTMPKGRPPYVSEWLLHWLHNVARPRVEATTWHGSYRQKVTELICPYFERTFLPDLDEEMIEAWHRQLERKVSSRTGRPLSASTIGQAHRIFSSALRVAVARGKMPRNPCTGVTPPQARRKRPAPPTEAEAARILERCSSWPNGARWNLAMTTGIRQGEALALEWRNIRLEQPASVTIELSAARADGERIIKAPKSDKGCRTISLPAVAAAALKAHRSSGVRSLEGLVFLSPRGLPVHPRADWQDWQNLLADLGLPHYRVHDLRHATATWLLEEGVDVRVVQEILGHATPAFTQAAYQHVTPRLQESAAAAMDQRMKR